MEKKNHGFVIASAVLGSLLATISTAYAAMPTVSSAKITGTNTATIVYSEPVTSNLADYSNLSGALGGRNLTGLSGSGTNTIVLTFDGAAFVPDANGGLAIATTTASVSDHTPFGGGTIAVSDGQVPLLASLTVSSGGSGLPLAKAGGSVMLTFSTNESINSPTVSVLGHQIAAIGGATGPYTVNYVMSSGDPEGTVLVTISMPDIAGNVGKITLSLTNANGIVPVPVVTPPTPVPAPVPVPAPTLPTSFTPTVPSGQGVGTPTSSVGAVATDVENKYQALIKDLEQKKAQLQQMAATPSLSASAKFDRPLSVGSIGDDVKELQKRLTAEGLYKGAITGKFGAQTRDAVKAYQKKNRLTQLGTVGPSTRALLNK